MKDGLQYIPVGDVDRRIVEIEELLRELPVELAALKRIRSGAIVVTVNESVATHEQTILSAERLGPRDAVLNFLRRNARKTARETVDTLANLIQTNAKDRRQVLKSTIYNLVKNGTLDEDDQGRLTVPVNGRASET